jgi:hypothetical protein
MQILQPLQKYLKLQYSSEFKIVEFIFTRPTYIYRFSP